MKYVVLSVMIVSSFQLYAPRSVESVQKDIAPPGYKESVDKSRDALWNNLPKTIVGHRSVTFTRTEAKLCDGGNIRAVFTSEQGDKRAVTYVPARNRSGFSESAKSIAIYKGEAAEPYALLVTEPGQVPCLIDGENRARLLCGVSCEQYY